MSVGMAAQQAGFRFLVQHSSSGLQENTLLGSSSPGSKGYDPLAIMLRNIYSNLTRLQHCFSGQEYCQLAIMYYCIMVRSGESSLAVSVSSLVRVRSKRS